MNTIIFNVNGTDLEAVNTIDVTSGTQNLVAVKFIISDTEIAGFEAKYGVFGNDKKNLAMVEAVVDDVNTN